jgi:hypothetical protein
MMYRAQPPHSPMPKWPKTTHHEHYQTPGADVLRWDQKLTSSTSPAPLPVAQAARLLSGLTSPEETLALLLLLNP